MRGRVRGRRKGRCAAQGSESIHRSGNGEVRFPPSLRFRLLPSHTPRACLFPLLLQRLFRLFAAVKTSVTWRPPSELVMSDRDRERSAAPVVVLKDVMKAQIMRKGLALLFDAEAQREPPKLIQALLDLRDKYGRVVEAAFHNDRMYQVGLKEVRLVMPALQGILAVGIVFLKRWSTHSYASTSMRPRHWTLRHAGL
jgi:hypothetical protein